MDSQAVELPIVEQVKPAFSYISFVERPKYSTEIQETVIAIMYNLVKLAIGEVADISDLVGGPLIGKTITYEESKTESSVEKSQTSESIGSDSEECKTAPFILVLDNAHMMDPASWELYEALRDGCYRLAIIIILQTDYNDSVKIRADQQSTFERVWNHPSMEDNRVIELPSFSKESLE